VLAVDIDVLHLEFREFMAVFLERRDASAFEFHLKLDAAQFRKPTNQNNQSTTATQRKRGGFKTYSIWASTSNASGDRAGKNCNAGSPSFGTGAFRSKKDAVSVRN
jgi:hypothetical protein